MLYGPYACLTASEVGEGSTQITTEFVNPLHGQIFSVVHDKEILKLRLIKEGHDAGAFEAGSEHVPGPCAAIVMGPSQVHAPG